MAERATLLTAKALGGEVIGPHRVLCPGPGHSARDRSLSVLLSASAPDGFVVWSFAGDSSKDCREHVKALLGIERQVTNRSDRCLTSARSWPERKGDYWQRLWNDAGQVRGTVAERYLQSRKLSFSPELNDALRFHPRLVYEGRFVPGIVALFRDIISNEPVGVHRTFLAPSGEKIGRKMLGRARGAVIKLDGDEYVTSGLFGGEGIESCLAGRHAGFRPCWALGSAGAIATFPVLAGIEVLAILGEVDDGGANADAAKKCATRWTEAGREFFIVQPIAGDLNDVWSSVN
jgi:putative DNA primase/helicase